MVVFGRLIRVFMVDIDFLVNVLLGGEAVDKYFNSTSEMNN